jgi:hypothetical protein
MKHRLLKAATMPDNDRIDQMENDVKAIVLSLSNINDTLNTHTDMLAEILAAATEEPDEESGIAKTLSRIFQALETQNENLDDRQVLIDG